jgi:molybdopterin converting factor subunit 1
MHVTVRYFALVREIVGRRTEDREVPEGTSAGDLIDQIVSEYPTIERLRQSTMLMVNQEYVEPAHMLSEGDEVALIPPVSGGAGPFRVTEDVIDPRAVSDAVADPGAGAIITFVGTVRNTARGRDVLYLDYEAYPAAAEKMLTRIGDEIAERWGIDRVAITHRIGRLQIGEASVAIVVSSPHRNEAFEACHYAIERIKQIVPVWKKEYYAGGDFWVGSEAAYQKAFGRP